MAPLSRIIKAVQVVRYMGAGWVLFRLRMAARKRLKTIQKRAPLMPWASVQTGSAGADQPGFKPWPASSAHNVETLAAFDANLSGLLANRLTEIQSGHMHYFSHAKPVDVGVPTSWHTNHIDNITCAELKHFDTLHEFAFGDVKLIWEPSRFAFAFDLARVYARTQDPVARQLFFTLLKHWTEANPLNAGINWKCGQEAALRVFAVSFALQVMTTRAPLNPDEITLVLQFMAGSGNRILADLDYQVSQNNNHGMSAAEGLITIALLYPQLPNASLWLRTGEKSLLQQLDALIYPDGGFSQYSCNYHRLMLHGLLWTLSIAQRTGYTLHPAVKQKIIQAGKFLWLIQDAQSGSVPRMGNDDGALILHLTHCGYDDFRPVIQSAASLGTAPLPFPPGPWDEERFWLFGQSPASTDPQTPPARPQISTLPDTGCVVLRPSESAMAFIRAGHLTHRVSHRDQGHVDLWFQGINIALDPGTYSYNASSHWSGIPLAHAQYHNTVTVDGKDQADPVSRFLYLPPPHGKLLKHGPLQTSGLVFAHIQNESYLRLKNPVTHHRRLIGTPQGHWLVIDTLTGSAPFTARLHWALPALQHTWQPQERRMEIALPSGPYSMQASAVSGEQTSCNLVQADPASPRGWRATRYRELAPSLSFALEAKGSPVTFVTGFWPGACVLEAKPDALTINTPSSRLSLRMASGIPQEARWEGSGGVQTLSTNDLS